LVGKTLGHYEILEPLGKGGMGEVYRVRDTTRKREVALSTGATEDVLVKERSPAGRVGARRCHSGQARPKSRIRGLGGSWQPVATVWEDRQDA